MLEVSLTHDFPGFALRCDFTAPAGVTALFGRSGSGKTTIVNAIAGLIRPQEGRIAIDGTVLLDTTAGIFLPPHRRHVGYVFQDARLFPHLSVASNLTYGARFAGRRDPAAFRRMVDLLGLGPLLTRRPGRLSGGEKQRVALGRALLAAPRILLLDEPLAALDEQRKAEILPYVERLRDEVRLPILYVSHSVSEVARLANTLIMVEAGRVTRTGRAVALLSDPETAHAFGLREVGAVLTGRVAGHDSDGLTRVEIAAGALWLPRVEATVGSAVRLRISAQDVILARERPVGLSALNILEGEIAQVRQGDGPGVLVQIRVADDLLLARVTRRSAASMGLAVRQRIFAIVKSVAIAPGDVGRG